MAKVHEHNANISLVFLCIVLYVIPVAKPFKRKLARSVAVLIAKLAHVF